MAVPGAAPLDGGLRLKVALGTAFSTADLTMKMAEWTSFASHVTQWERDNPLDI